jgi:hypothetical protein
VVDEVVWICEAEHSLRRVLDQLPVRTLLGRIAGGIDAAEIPTRFRDALRVALTAEEPIRSVEQLADRLGLDRRTLWYHWRNAAAADAAGPKELLSWILLIRAVVLKISGRSWSGAAASLGTDSQTLARVARRCTGSSLLDLCSTGVGPLVATFEREVISQLILKPPRADTSPQFPTMLESSRSLVCQE